MKVIVISEEAFEREFKATLEKLRADRFDQGVKLDDTAKFENSPIGQMYSRFVYEVCGLRKRLESAQ